MCAALLLALLLPTPWCTSARAHPFEDGSVGHLLQLEVHPERLVIHYRVEIPTRRVMEEMRQRELAGARDRGEGYTAEKITEIESGLYLRVDGESAALQRLPLDEETGVGNQRFFLFDVRLEAPLGPGARRLDLSNGNYPDERGYFSTAVQVHDDWQVLDSSLLELKGNEVLRDDSERWQTGAAGREVVLSLAPRPAWAARSGELRPLAESVGTRLPIGWAAGGGALWMLLLAGGLYLRRRR